MTADLYLEWGADLVLTPSGSLQPAVGWDHVRQRILRRMITSAAGQLPDGTMSPADYVFAPDFGVGLGKLVDAAESADFRAGLERSISLAVLQDADVDSSIPPSVVFQALSKTTLRIVISVTLKSGQEGEIALQVH